MEVRAQFLILVTATGLAAAGPEIVKVEPPNWWTVHSLNPVRVVMQGRNLCGASVKARLPVSRVVASASCSYLFAEVKVTTGLRPGAYPLTVSNADGSTTVPFELLAPLRRDGRFQGFSTDDVMYLIMPDRFANGDRTNDSPAEPSNARRYHGGDLEGIRQRLGYLKDLGVTAIWLNPVYENTGTDYHGYHAVDFYAVEDHLGTISRLRELVDEAHRHGIKVILDQVANHAGPRHLWVNDPPRPTWLNGTSAAHLANTWQTWTLMDPRASPELQRATLEGWFMNRLPDLNQDDEEVKRYLIQNTLWWIGMTGIDGIRQDTLPYVHRRFWRDWSAAIKREYTAFQVVGEVFDSDPALVSFFQTGRKAFDGIDSGIDTLFDFPLYFPLRRAFGEGKALREVASMLAHDGLYPDASVLVTHLGLHDVPRFMHVAGATVEGLKLGFTFLMTTRGTPLVYYGDEIAMRGGGDPDNRRDFPPKGFSAEGRTAEQDSVWQHIRALTALRRRLEPLRRGALVQLHALEQQYVYARRNASGQMVVVALNNSPGAAAVDFELTGAADGQRADALGSGVMLAVSSGRARAELPPRSGAIFELR